MAATESTAEPAKNYYEILGLPWPPPDDLSQLDIKSAYHRTLLHVHPDKVHVNDGTKEAVGANVNIVKEAWEVLGNDALRKEYEKKLKAGTRAKNAFVSVDLDDMTYNQDTATYSFPCRCGTARGFEITEDDLDKGKDLVECRGCSCAIHVSYETVAVE